MVQLFTGQNRVHRSICSEIGGPLVDRIYIFRSDGVLLFIRYPPDAEFRERTAALARLARPLTVIKIRVCQFVC